jgi:hypothetical protein
MAANYTFLNQWPSSALIGGNNVVPTTEFAYQTEPDTIYFQFRRPQSQLVKLAAADRAALANSIADQLATRIEAVYNEANVSDIAYSQGQTAAGQITDLMTIYITTDSGDSQGTVTIPMANIGPGAYTDNAIQTELAALQAVEAATATSPGTVNVPAGGEPNT